MTDSLGPFYVGDSPAVPVELDLDGDQDYSLYTSADAILRNAEGVTVATWTALAIDEETIVLSIPVGALVTSGVYRLVPRLVGHGSITLPGVPVIVQQEDGWHTVDSAREQWAGAPGALDLFEALDVAKRQVLAYAPVLAVGALVPLTYRKAQLAQARNLANASVTNPDGQWGGDGSIIRIFPMDWSVKNMLRPTSPRVVIG